MNTDNLITPESLAESLKMAAEAISKKPGVMKSAVGYMELVHKYVERIVTAREQGKFVATDPGFGLGLSARAHEPLEPGGRNMAVVEHHASIKEVNS